MTSAGTNKNIGVGRGRVNAARKTGETNRPLAFRQLGWNARCGRGKRFTIMKMLPSEPQDAKQPLPTERVRRSSDSKPFDGVERRRNPDSAPDVVPVLPESNEVE